MATQGGLSSTPTSCTVTQGNTMMINNPFGRNGSYSVNGFLLAFNFSGGLNPIASGDAGTFTVTTYATINAMDYVIDQSTFSNVYNATPSYGSLAASLTSISSYMTSASPATYSFNITPNKSIP